MQAFLEANRESGAPRLTLAADRLQREVTFREEVVNGLAQQYENARIREVRDTPVITVIERPVLPRLPDPRGRVTLLVLATFGATLLGVAFVLAREGWARQYREDNLDPSYAFLADEWAQARNGRRRAERSLPT